MFEKVLIANHGAIACRIIRNLRRMGVKSVAVYTEADALLRHVIEADEAYCIGSGVAAESYSATDMIRRQNMLYLTAGSQLYSNFGNVMLTIAPIPADVMIPSAAPVRLKATPRIMPLRSIRCTATAQFSACARA
jgi:hypothetical protein